VAEEQDPVTEAQALRVALRKAEFDRDKATGLLQEALRIMTDAQIVSLREKLRGKMNVK
jgi:hypothetical protein